MNTQLDDHKERLAEVGAKIDSLQEELSALRETCRDVLRLDRLLDYDQSWAIHDIARRVAKTLSLPDAQPIEFFLSDVLMEKRLELLPLQCRETADVVSEQ